MNKPIVLRIAAVFLLLNVFSVYAAGKKAVAGESSPERVVTDLAGRKVSLAPQTNRAIAIAGPSYEKVFLLGGASRLVGAHFYTVDRPWVRETNPASEKIALIRSPAEPNVEALLTLNPDCVFFWDYDAPLRSMMDAGIPVVVVQNSKGNPKTADEFIAYQKKEIGVFAQALGADAMAKAADWNAYFDEKIAFVSGRTASIPPEKRKTVIYAYGEDGLGLFSEYSYVSYWVSMAGGINAADATRAEMDTVVTLEQIIRWNPDLIFMGRMENAAPVLGNPAWAHIKAVVNGEVHICPDGVMYWDYSSEGVLLMLFLAQKMYPDLFGDVNMVKETQNYYKRFYGYDLSAENAARILSHQGPVGK